MTASLSEEQQQEIAREGNGPIRSVHPTTQKEYVLLAADLFDRDKSIFDDDQFGAVDNYAAQSAAGWDDPEMDVYDTMMINGPDHERTSGEIVLVNYPFASGTGSKSGQRLWFSAIEITVD